MKHEKSPAVLMTCLGDFLLISVSIKSESAVVLFCLWQ